MTARWPIDKQWTLAQPIPADADAAGKVENCPVCGAWLAPRRDRVIRKHSRAPREACAGSLTADNREHLVAMISATTGGEVRYTVSSRGDAEIMRRGRLRRDPDDLVEIYAKR